MNKNVNKIVKKLYKINDKLRGTSITMKQYGKLKSALTDLEIQLKVLLLETR